MSTPAGATQQQAALEQRLEALRAGGAWRADPVRFRFMQVLASRIPGQPEAVQRLLRDKLRASLEAFEAQAGRSPQADGAGVAPRRAAPRPDAGGHLARLNQEIRGAAGRARGEGGGDELGSVRRFRRSWERQRTLQQVEKAVARKPAQAGPLNSHALVLQALELMQALSPDYLRQFVVQVETLQWLELAQAPAATAAGPGRAAKAAQRPRARPRKG